MAQQQKSKWQQDREDEAAKQALVVQPPRLPYPANDAPEGITPGKWKALVDAIFPSARTVDGVMLAIEYCKSRGLDVFKRAVHIVPMYNSALGRDVETVWPGINELRTTAARTNVYAGNDNCVFGPTLKRGFKVQVERQKRNSTDKYVQREECDPFEYPEWAQITVYKIVGGVRCPFVGPRILFSEAFSGIKGLRVPNAKWQESPFWMLEKCAEAAALRRAFPEELANVYAAEEMEGKDFASITVPARAVEIGETAQGEAGDDPAKAADARPTRENVAAAAPWVLLGITDFEWHEIEKVQKPIDATIDVVALRKAKDDNIGNAVADGWCEAALDELEKRFDTRIAELTDDTATNGGTDNEQATD